MGKSPDAFRTISEVADWLGIQAHVLRFWESKFTQVRPVKRAGGRRYYRPGDMLLLGGIKQLLHEDGLTIKGVQKILREEGMSHVAAMSQPLDELTQSQMEDIPEATFIDVPEDPAEETGVVLSFETPAQKAEPAVTDTPEPAPAAETATQAPSQPQDSRPADPAPAASEDPVIAAKADSVPVEDNPPPQMPKMPDVPHIDVADPRPAPPSEPAATDQAVAGHDAPDGDAPAAEPDAPAAKAAEPEPETPAKPDSHAVEPIAAGSESDTPAKPEPDALTDGPASAPPAEDGANLPAFLRRAMPQQPAPQDNTPPETQTAAPAPAETAEKTPPAVPLPRVIDLPPITPHDQIDASPSLLSTVHRTRHLNTEQARKIAPLLDKLVILRDSMAARRRGNGPNP